VLDLNYISFSNPNPTPNPIHSPKHKTVSPNHQFYLRIRYVKYYFVHVDMAWSQKFRKSGISLDTGSRLKAVFCISVSGCKPSILPDIQPTNRIVIFFGEIKQSKFFVMKHCWL